MWLCVHLLILFVVMCLSIGLVCAYVLDFLMFFSKVVNENLIPPLVYIN